MNRLARERSPYLLQHAGNPVQWYPWGEEAFEKARAENKPIFLSIGYSTCHWCHVMAHESFEDPAIAKQLNDMFVSIKVDREERPDVDRVYMAFVQATTGSGGWPMTVFLTPQLKPFYGGTYFPPASRWGRPGFAELLQEITRAWHEDRPRVEFAAAELLDRLRSVTGADGRERPEHALAGPDALDEAIEQYQTAFDRERGGFGVAPKFPRPSELIFLLREFGRRGGVGRAPDAPRLMATDTLRAMALGGMRDLIGGGFHRYAVDAGWRVPHFEKMLYDQAQLVIAYIEASLATGDQFFAAVAEDTIEYVLRDLRDPLGGFYSAEDADSLAPAAAGGPAEKREGAYYVWSDAEIDSVLGDDAAIARRRFDIRPGGNAPADPQGEFAGQNVLYAAVPIEDLASATGKTADEVVAALGRIRQALFDARASRVRPHLDDKVITSWNGLMIAALARTVRAIGPGPRAARYLGAAQAAARFVRDRLWHDDGRLLRRYRDGEAGIAGYAEDYACLAWGLLELFQADGDPGWLLWARAVQAAMDARFWDPEEGGWFSTAGDDASVLLRLKEEYDGAEPAASSVAVLNLITLAHLTGDADARAKAERTLARYGLRIGRAARTLPMMLTALSAWYAGASQVVIVGPHHREDTDRLTAAAGRAYRPFALVLPIEPQAGARLADLMPEVSSMAMRDARATAYVCRDFSCQAPVTTVADLEAQLAE
ncbi:MAG TPA: thioredoxin domain-containing protein [Vicinamibacterales bacterium]|nr:thioredoxin domain-containing protein [Vicinamibacterales bacterium]